jgi:hypothetical protein
MTSSSLFYIFPTNGPFKKKKRKIKKKQKTLLQTNAYSSYVLRRTNSQPSVLHITNETEM